MPLSNLKFAQLNLLNAKSATETADILRKDAVLKIKILEGQKTQKLFEVSSYERAAKVLESKIDSQGLVTKAIETRKLGVEAQIISTLSNFIREPGHDYDVQGTVILYLVDTYGSKAIADIFGGFHSIDEVMKGEGVTPQEKILPLSEKLLRNNEVLKKYCVLMNAYARAITVLAGNEGSKERRDVEKFIAETFEDYHRRGILPLDAYVLLSVAKDLKIKTPELFENSASIRGIMDGPGVLESRYTLPAARTHREYMDRSDAIVKIQRQKIDPSIKATLDSGDYLKVFHLLRGQKERQELSLVASKGSSLGSVVIDLLLAHDPNPGVSINAIAGLANLSYKGTDDQDPRIHVLGLIDQKKDLAATLRSLLIYAYSKLPPDAAVEEFSKKLAKTNTDDYTKWLIANIVRNSKSKWMFGPLLKALSDLEENGHRSNYYDNFLLESNPLHRAYLGALLEIAKEHADDKNLEDTLNEVIKAARDNQQRAYYLFDLRNIESVLSHDGDPYFNSFDGLTLWLLLQHFLNPFFGGWPNIFIFPVYIQLIFDAVLFGIAFVGWLPNSKIDKKLEVLANTRNRIDITQGRGGARLAEFPVLNQGSETVIAVFEKSLGGSPVLESYGFKDIADLLNLRIATWKRILTGSSQGSLRSLDTEAINSEIKILVNALYTKPPALFSGNEETRQMSEYILAILTDTDECLKIEYERILNTKSPYELGSLDNQRKVALEEARFIVLRTKRYFEQRKRVLELVASWRVAVRYPLTQILSRIYGYYEQSRMIQGWMVQDVVDIYKSDNPEQDLKICKQKALDDVRCLLSSMQEATHATNRPSERAEMERRSTSREVSTFKALTVITEAIFSGALINIESAFIVIALNLGPFLYNVRKHWNIVAGLKKEQIAYLNEINAIDQTAFKWGPEPVQQAPLLSQKFRDYLTNINLKRQRAIFDRAKENNPLDIIIIMVGSNGPTKEILKVIQESIPLRETKPLVVLIPDSPEFSGSFFAAMRAHEYIQQGESLNQLLTRLDNDQAIKDANQGNQYFYDKSVVAAALKRNSDRWGSSHGNGLTAAVIYAGGNETRQARVADQTGQGLPEGWSLLDSTFAIAIEEAERIRQTSSSPQAFTLNINAMHDPKIRRSHLAFGPQNDPDIKISTAWVSSEKIEGQSRTQVSFNPVTLRLDGRRVAKLYRLPKKSGSVDWSQAYRASFTPYSASGVSSKNISYSNLVTAGLWSANLENGRFLSFSHNFQKRMKKIAEDQKYKNLLPEVLTGLNRTGRAFTVERILSLLVANSLDGLKNANSNIDKMRRDYESEETDPARKSVAREIFKQLRKAVKDSGTGLDIVATVPTPWLWPNREPQVSARAGARLASNPRLRKNFESVLLGVHDKAARPQIATWFEGQASVVYVGGYHPTQTLNHLAKPGQAVIYLDHIPSHGQIQSLISKAQKTQALDTQILGIVLRETNAKIIQALPAQRKLEIIRALSAVLPHIHPASLAEMGDDAQAASMIEQAASQVELKLFSPSISKVSAPKEVITGTVVYNTDVVRADSRFLARVIRAVHANPAIEHHIFAEAGSLDTKFAHDFPGIIHWISGPLSKNDKLKQLGPVSKDHVVFVDTNEAVAKDSSGYLELILKGRYSPLGLQSAVAQILSGRVSAIRMSGLQYIEGIGYILALRRVDVARELQAVLTNVSALKESA